MRIVPVIAVLVWISLYPSAAQPTTSRLVKPLAVGSELSGQRVGQDENGPTGGRFLHAFGGALLGAAIGGGLGWLVGPIPKYALYRDCQWRYRDCEDEVHLAPFGVWLGGTVGAMAGAGAEVDGGALLTATFGSGLGSLIGLGAFATASNGRGPWSGIGFVVGAAAGAAFGATVAAPDLPRRVGIVHARGDQWSVRIPTVAAQPPRGSVGRPTVHVVLLSARW